MRLSREEDREGIGYQGKSKRQVVRKCENWESFEDDSDGKGRRKSGRV